jgi:hypothetical protein
VHPGRGEPEHYVAGRDLGAVDQLLPLDDADAGGREVELVLAVDVGHLGRLAADQRDAGGAADLGRALHQLCHLFELDAGRRDVVEQDERVGAARDDVVDAVRRHVGAAVAKQTAGAGDHRLRADRVGGGGEEPVIVERVKRGECAEPRGAGRLDRGAEAVDDRLGRRKRDAGSVVRAPFLAHGPSLRRPPDIRSSHVQGSVS